MPVYRDSLPQLDGGLFITDGGLETTLLFKLGIEIPESAAFHLLRHRRGRETIRRYFEPYLAVARKHRTGFILETPTWRANPYWAAKLGYTRTTLDIANREAVELMQAIRDGAGDEIPRLVISGCIGPRHDAYFPETQFSVAEAENYHDQQIATLADTSADMITAFTLTHTREAIGITRAAVRHEIPVAIGFTVETDGRLPSTQSLQQAIAEVDAATGKAPVYYMINCAHPGHFMPLLRNRPDWADRIRCIRANASCKSHAELDNSETLDEGDPAELGELYESLRQVMNNLTVVGGCCGTSHEHIAAIAQACA